MKRLALSLAATLACGLSAGAYAAGAADKVSAVGPFIRLAPPGAQATGAYMVLKNGGDKDVTVVKASSPAAKVAELHDHINDGGVMKMRPVPSITIKARGDVVLKPGSLHVMLVDLNAPMKEGDKVAIMLGFDDGSSKQVDATVMKPAPMPAMPAPASAPMDHSAHQH
jgi:periplasmic copper chaperone A